MTMFISAGNVTNWSPGNAGGDSWDMLGSEVARGATCVVAVTLPASAVAPTAMMAGLRNHERDRAARLRVPDDRHLYIIAHYLLACSVEVVAACGPASWSFVPNGNDGKPRLMVANQTLHASLSHTRGAVAVAISRVADVGVDVEAITPMTELELVVNDVLSDRERQAVFADAQPIRMFTRLWTRKEAVVKAIGAGLSVPLASIDVLDPTNVLRPPELSGAVCVSDLPCARSCQLSVALLSPGIDPVSLEIPFAMLVEQATGASIDGIR
jgi:4'-phosphopantetheinyl transferase